ncbi:hypothetical protein [Salibacterium aidingense]|uniref:hypothetical protein n=1 Tax=Salibacterium aidingense TaxID=384933 RepID=UPI000421AAA7|nr:hypothetical protein [Salibacterium aidingense]
MEQSDVKHAFLAMMYTANNEGMDHLLEKKWLELEETILKDESKDSTDLGTMIDNIDSFYQKVANGGGSDTEVAFVIQKRETQEIIMVTTNSEKAFAHVHEGSSVVITGMPLTS